MCGIAGIIDYNQKGFVERDVLARMCKAMQHRGPDDEGIYIKSIGDRLTVGLGHRRLSIIDLSVAGHQPMHNEDGSVSVVFNGEIYNYRQLREALKQKGHIFKSHTDTEVVMHLYEDCQGDCVSRLRGMFAFAVWDEKNETLLLARDRFGKKPLLYTYKNGVLAFASEFKSLLESGTCAKEVNLSAIRYYVDFGYIPAPISIYKDIFKVPPATCLTLKKNKLELRRYWQLDYTQKIKITEEDAASEVMRLLKDAVQARLYSDVALGAFLSGGIDSSSVVALMSQLTGQAVKTFSIGFDEQQYNELGFARAVAKRYCSEHHEFIVKPNALEILPELVEHYGEPYADSSCIPTYYVCRETKKYVKVALNGDGGDELFAGYDRYAAMQIAQYYQKIPRPLRAFLNTAISVLLKGKSGQRNTLARIKRFTDAAGLPFEQRYARWVGIFNEDTKRAMFSDFFLKETIDTQPQDLLRPYLKNRNGKSILDALLEADSMTYLPYDLLVKVDIVSMANSLEVRSPFLDHHLAEFAAKLPDEYKIKNLCKKYILKKAVKGLIPEENINRKKMGFGMPIGEWFKGSLKDFLYETLNSKYCLKRGYFKDGAVKNIMDRHIGGKEDNSLRLWSLLMLELWHRRFID